MAAPREPRSFLYDDYMDTDLYGRGGDEYGTSDSRMAPRRMRENALDMELDSLPVARGSRMEAAAPVGFGGARRRATGGGYIDDRLPVAKSVGGAHSRRFADALGIPNTIRQQHAYDDLQYGDARGAGRALAVQQRVVYRDIPTARVAPVRQLVRRRVVQDELDDYDDMDAPGRQEVVEVVERVRRAPQRRVQIVKRVPIQQRVIKKVYVQAGGRSSFGGRNRLNKPNNNIGRVQNRSPIQKKKFAGGGPRGNNAGGGGRGAGAGPSNFKNKPKMTASELDRELEAYMGQTKKHPRI